MENSKYFIYEKINIKQFYEQEEKKLLASILKIKDMKLDKIPVILQITDNTNRKIEDYEIFLSTKDKNVNLKTDSAGRITYIADRLFLKNDPIIKTKTRDENINISLLPLNRGFFSYHPTSKEVKAIFLPTKEIHKTDDIEIYYPISEKDNVDKYFKILKSIKDVIETLGIPPLKPWQTYLNPTFHETQASIILSTDPIWHVMNSSLDDKFHYVNAHEWTELSIGYHNRWVMDQEQHLVLRWITEGISEYSAFTVSLNLNLPYDDRVSEIEEALAQGIEKYNLEKYYKELGRDDILGWLVYPTALYLWTKIIKKCGEEIIAKFLSEGSNLDKPSDKNLQNLLSELTGLDIPKELQNIDLKDALVLLKETWERK